MQSMTVTEIIRIGFIGSIDVHFTVTIHILEQVHLSPFNLKFMDPVNNGHPLQLRELPVEPING